MEKDRIGRRQFLQTAAIGAASTVLGCNVAGPQYSSRQSPAASATGKSAISPRYTIACYYFPNYHVDPHNEAQHGPGWTEWELVKNAKPRFDGHQQPKVPLWGYVDESDPAVMARKIDAAANHSIDAFIFDWYWYNNGPFLQRALERGFLKAANNKRLKFSLMWANHDWQDIQPRTLKKKVKTLYPGKVTAETFETMTSYIIENYFKHPSYWKLDGCPYFSIYELYMLVASFGSLNATKEMLRRFREKTRAAGFAGLHLNAVTWGIKILPGETAVKNPAELVNHIGFDSISSYVWIHHAYLHKFPQTQYQYVMEEYFKYCYKTVKQFDLPYYPNVTMGWDSSPRADQSDPFVNKGYPFMATIGGNTPQAFKEALIRVKQFLDQRPPEQRIFNINCWNEWTEGSYLEPDTVHGMAYLKAIKEVFGNKQKK